MELLAVKIDLQTFLKSLLYFNSHTNVQNRGFDIPEKNQGNQESENDNTVKRDLGNVNFSADHDNYEVLPSSLNKVADFESRRTVDSSEWVLSQKVVCNLCLKLRTPTIDLTALGVSHQVAQ